MTDLTQPPQDIASASPVRLDTIDRSTVALWAQRARSNKAGRWQPIAAPEDRRSLDYLVIAQLVSGEWIRVTWGQGVGSGGSRPGRPAGPGRPPGRKNNKPRADKGVKRTRKKKISEC